MDVLLALLLLGCSTLCYGCTPPTSVLHTYLTPNNSSYTENGTVTYVCNGSFIISGNTQLTCQSGAWVGSLPTCVPVCPSTQLPNSYIISTGPYYSGTTIKYNCQAGFGMYGQSTRTCGTDYKWIGNPPSCNQLDQAPKVKNSDKCVYAPDGYVSEATVTDSVDSSEFIEDEGVVPVAIFGAMLGILIVGKIVFLIIRICCCGPGSKCPGFGACCMGCCGLGQTAGYTAAESGTGCCGCCKKNTVKYDKLGGANKKNTVSAWQEKQRRSQANPPYNQMKDTEYYPDRPGPSQAQYHGHHTAQCYGQTHQQPQPRYYSPVTHLDSL